MDDFNDPTDAQLAERFKQGDRLAYEELYNRHHKKTWRVIRWPVHNEADVQELNHDAWERIWRTRETYDATRSDFLGFARMHAFFVLLNYWERKRRRIPEVFLSTVEARFPELTKYGEFEEALRRMRTSDTPRGTSSGGTPGAEKMLEVYQAYQEMLRIACGDAIPPHQFLAFGFCKLLERKPKEIAEAQYAGCALEYLTDRFAKEFGLIIPQRQWNPYLVAFHDRLKRTVGEVVSDSETRELYPLLFERICGRTMLQEYFTGNPETNVSHWWHTVKRRVWSEVHKEGKGALFDF